MLVTEKKDLEIILQIQKQAFTEEAIRYNDFEMPAMTQTPEEMEKEFDNGTFFFKYLVGNEIAGSVRANLHNSVCNVARLVVHPDHQGKGIGNALMNELEAYFKGKCQSFRIFTGEKSILPLSMYTKLGYKITHNIHTGSYYIIHMEKINC